MSLIWRYRCRVKKGAFRKCANDLFEIETYRKSTMRIHNKNLVEYLISILSALTIIACIPISTTFSVASAKETKSDIFSLKFENKPLMAVIDTISEITGSEILVNEGWEKLPVTVTLNQVTLHRALRRIIGKFDHAIIYNAGNNKIYITIFGDSKSNMVNTDVIDLSDIEVIPPDEEGDKGVTERELNALLALQEKKDLLDLDVIPPDEPGGKGITQRELDAMESKGEKINSDPDVIPPDEPGGKGIKQSELDVVGSSRKKLSSDSHVIPPDDESLNRGLPVKN